MPQQIILSTDEARSLDRIMDHSSKEPVKRPSFLYEQLDSHPTNRIKSPKASNASV